MQASAQRHIQGFDLFRGTGALLVLVFHAAQPFAGATLLHHGYLAVDMFFMLSGYVLAARFEGDLASGKLSIVRYLIGRVRKLYSLLATGVLLGAAVAALGVIPCYAIGSSVVLHLLIIPSLACGYSFALDPAEWSLFCELTANALHAFLAPLLTTRRLSLLVIALGLIFSWTVLRNGTADLGSTGQTTGLGMLRATFEFLLGALLFRRGRTATRGPAAALMALVVFVTIIFASGAADDGTGLADLAAIASFPMLLAMAATGQLDGAIGRAARQTAIISYPLYAIHYPLLFVARHMIDPLAPGPGPIVAYAAVLIAIVLLAWLIAALPNMAKPTRFRPIAPAMRAALTG